MYVCVVCARKAENKSSVRYEVIGGIISIINQRLSRGAGGRGGKEGGRGRREGRAEDERRGRERGREGRIIVCNFKVP